MPSAAAEAPVEAIVMKGLPSRYQLQRLIGWGGMGRVYCAFDRELRRRVAIKMLQRSDASLSHMIRREREVLAALDDPGIVAVYDSGELDDGQPYYVMQFVEGVSLDQYITESRRPRPVLLRLIADAARSVGKAHELRIIHRDLKPQNIKVTPDGHAKVLDFGLAKSVQTPTHEASQMAGQFSYHSMATGRVVGTLAYMSPEQAGGEPLDARTDVYALGVILYEVLSGQLPFDPTASGCEVAKLSDFLRSHQPQPLRELVPQLPVEVAAVVYKCLARDRAERYANATELADDLMRCQQSRPVRALPGLHPVYRATRFVRRNRLPVAIAMVAMAGILFSIVGLVHYREQRGETNAAREIARLQQQQLLWEKKAKAEEARARHEEERARRNAEQLAQERQTEAEARRREARTRQYGHVIQQSDLALRAGQRQSEVLRGLDKDLLELAGWEAWRIALETKGIPEHTVVLSDHSAAIIAAALTHDGRRLISAGADGRMLLWDLSRVSEPPQILVEGCWDSFRRQWQHFYTQRVGLATLSSAEFTRVLGSGEESEYFLDLCPLGGRPLIGAASLDGLGVVFDLSTEPPSAVPRQTVFRSSEPLHVAAGNADGSRLLFGSAAGRVSLCQVERPNETLAHRICSDAAVTAAVWCDSFGLWLVGCRDGEFCVLDGTTLDVLQRRRLNGGIWCLDVTEESDRVVVTVGYDHPELAVFQLSGAKPVLHPIGSLGLPTSNPPPRAVHAVRFTDGGAAVLGGDSLGRLIKWDLRTGRVQYVTQAISRGSRRETLFEVPDKRNVREEQIRRSLFAARSATGLFDPMPLGLIQAQRHLQAAEQFAVGLPLPFHRIVTNILIAPEQNRVITTGEDMVIKLWDVSGTDAQSNSLNVGARPKLAFDPTGSSRLWAINRLGLLQIIDTSSKTVLGSVAAHSQGAYGFSVHSETAQVATAGEDGDIRFWAWREGRIVETRRPIRHERALKSVAWSHNGRWLAAVDIRGKLSVWRLENGAAPVLSEQLHGGIPGRSASIGEPTTGQVAFNCDDTWLAAFGPGQSCWLFRVEPFEKLNEGPSLAGTGGTAMMWHATDPHFLVVADDLRRHARFIIPGSTGTRMRLDLPKATTPWRAFVSSPDGKRWFLLEESGRPTVFEPDFIGTLLERESPNGNAWDLAIDPTGRCLALAHRDGSIEFWDSSPPAKPSPVQANCISHWSVTSLRDPAPEPSQAELKTISLDQQDRLCMLRLESGPTPSESALVFYEQVDNELIREVLHNSAKFDFNTISLTCGPNSGPVIVFRWMKELPDSDEVRLGLRILRRERKSAVFGRRRDAQGSSVWKEPPDSQDNESVWSAEDVPLELNAGFWNLPVPGRDGVHDIFHFAYAGYYLMRSSRTESGWATVPVGRHGDGGDMIGRIGPEGTAHMVYRSHRFGGDPGPRIYARWDGSNLVREVLDPTGISVSGTLCFGPEGIPLVLVRQSNSKLDSKYLLAYRTASRWETEPLPASLPLQDSSFHFAAGPDGRLYLLQWNELQRQLLLWVGRLLPGDNPNDRILSDSWNVTEVPDDWANTPIYLSLCIDSRGQPVVAVLRRDGNVSLLKVFRLTALVGS